jgi:methyl-accepting chemotaxis protein
MISEARNVSEVNSRSMQEVAAATQEVTATIMDLSHHAEELSTVAKLL